MQPTSPDLWHGTTILTVRKGGVVAIGGDGQVSIGQTVIKANAKKVRKLGKGDVIGGFAGATADAFTLFERLESKLEQYPGQLTRAAVELAKDWRTDRYLRRLEAMMIVADKEVSLVLTGTGDVLEPEAGVMAIGSGGNYALAAGSPAIDWVPASRPHPATDFFGNPRPDASGFFDIGAIETPGAGTTIAPTVTSVKPSTGRPGTAVAVIITGTNLSAATNVAVQGAGVSAGVITSRSPTAVTTTFTIAGTGHSEPMTTEDQVGVTGLLEGGAAFSIHYRGGHSRGTNLLWEINGTEGDLQLTAAGGQAQIFEMTVRGGRGTQSSLAVLPVPQQYRWAPPQGPSTNVAQAYARFARDYREGTHLCPTFDDAVTRHRMLDAIEMAAATGQRQTPG